MLSKFLSVLGGVGLVLGQVQYMGMNIAGFEFGCLIDGTCPIASINPPLTTLGGGDGAGQMAHFATDDHMNVFRLPVSWQFLTNNLGGGTLDATNFGKYDQLMQACLKTGTYCAIDVHNFARFNGLIIGQGGPTDAQFAALWTSLATKYATNSKVIFGLMNEPHELDVPTWANSVQAAVTAVRKAGATSQMILLPGTNFTSAGTFVSSGSADALIKVTNPDGSTDNLIFDLHKYLDVDNSGTNAECVTDNIADAFQPLAAYLRTNKRVAIISETGASSASSCVTDFCAQNTFINANSDVFLGLIVWGAGSLSTTYLDSLTPTKVAGKYVDNALASQCVMAPWLKAGGGTFVPVASAAASSTVTSITSSSTAKTTKAGTNSTAVTTTSAANTTAARTITVSQTTATQKPSTGAIMGLEFGLLAGCIVLALVL